MTVVDHIKKNKADCCGCYGCMNTCPTGAISFKFDEEGFWYPEVSDSLCIQCGKCVKVCPCVNIPKAHKKTKSFACSANNKDELLSSSSGGVFAVMAREILQNGGYVCGAVFDEDFSVVHQVIDAEGQLKKIKGTKYVQSKIGSVYSQIKELLEQNMTVLFSGTPCQVAGLVSFLGKEYDNLITVDLICHGVPSPVIWQDYLKEVSGDDKIVDVNFRNKENGIDNATIDFTFDNGDIKQSRYADDPYVKGFLNNYYLRPSCFECKFKGMKRCSDMTIGDFWAVKEYYPDFDSKYGTSAVITRSEKAQALIDRISKKVNRIEVKADHLSVWNENLLTSVKHTEKNIYFYKRRIKEPISVVIEELIGSENIKVKEDSFLYKIKKRISIMIHY